MNSTLLKDRLSVYGQLMRINRPIGTLLLLWPTLWGIWVASQGQPSLSIVVIFIIGTCLMRAAGCIINDYADRHFDAWVERTRHRPFARQVVSGKEAILLAASLTMLAGLLILTLNRLTHLLSVIALLIAASYPYTKRFFPLPQAYLGVAFSFGIPMAFAAIQNQIPGIAWLMMGATGFWIIAYDTAYAMVDKADDIKIGIHTAAITFGAYDITAIMLCHLAFLLLMGLAGWIIPLNSWYYYGLAAATILIIKQYVDIRQRDPARCFKAFLSNNHVGWVIFSGIVVSYWS